MTTKELEYKKHVFDKAAVGLTRILKELLLWETKMLAKTLHTREIFYEKEQSTNTANFIVVLFKKLPQPTHLQHPPP